MISNAKVSIISLYPNDDVSNFRYLDIVPKKTTKSLFDKFEIRLDQGCIITMCGTTQNEFVHGIAKSENEKSPRISLSFRQMCNDL
jgi:hypothetical protein